MSTINGLPPVTGVLARPRPRIMPARHGNRAGYHKAKYMPLNFSPQLPMGRQATPVEP
jgi:hypothetical protein